MPPEPTATSCASCSPATSTTCQDPVGQKVRRAGKFRYCKAIGWYVEQYKRAQISINLTNYKVTPPHLVLEEARRLAAERGLVVTGSEIVGLVPYPALLEAGKYYLDRQGESPRRPGAPTSSRRPCSPWAWATCRRSTWSRR